ncbi:MAG: hypothetical protein WCL39_07895 [Armatimonadota bacterium]
MKARSICSNIISRHSMLAVIGAALVGAILFPTYALCQGAKPDPIALAKRYSLAATANAEMMKSYGWSMRVEITLDGKTQPAQLYLMRYDSSGKLQKTGLTPAPQASKPGLRGSIQKKKMNEFKAWSDKLAELLKQYAAPTPGTMLDFYTKATYSAQGDGIVIVSGNNLLQQGDHADFWMDLYAGTPVQYSFSTNLQKDAVSATIQFDQIPGGPRYAATVNVEVPSKNMTAKIETFNYVRQTQGVSAYN